MKEIQEKGLVFIRKNGRIIPIHRKGNYNKIMEGSAGYEFGAAAGASLAGYGATRFMEYNASVKERVALRGRRIEQKALFFDKPNLAVKAANFSNRAESGARGARKIARNLKVGTFSLTSGLLAAGIQSTLASKIKDPNKLKEFGLTAGSLVAGIAGTAILGKLGIRHKTGKAFGIIRNLLKKKALK